MCFDVGHAFLEVGQDETEEFLATYADLVCRDAGFDDTVALEVKYDTSCPPLLLRQGSVQYRVSHAN